MLSTKVSRATRNLVFPSIHVLSCSPLLCCLCVVKKRPHASASLPPLPGKQVQNGSVCRTFTSTPVNNEKTFDKILIANRGLTSFHVDSPLWAPYPPTLSPLVRLDRCCPTTLQEKSRAVSSRPQNEWASRQFPSSPTRVPFLPSFLPLCVRACALFCRVCACPVVLRRRVRGAVL